MEALRDAIVEVRRECTIRSTVYPRLVAAGKLTQSEADRRLASLADAEAFLLKLLRHWDTVQRLDNDEGEVVHALRRKHDIYSTGS